MAYCVLADVVAEFKGVAFTATTSVTDTDVANFIAMEDEFINSRLALKYTVPVTGAASLLVLKKISLGLVVGKIKNILEVKTGESSADQGGAGSSLIKNARDMLQMIIEDTLLLRDAADATQTSAVASYLTGNGADYDPVFQAGVEQW